MRALALTLAFATVAGSLGCGSLDTPDKVHDLRMLAMRAEPPDQVFPVPAALIEMFLDAGAGNGNDGVQGFDLTPGCTDLLPTLQPVTVSGLIADPQGEGRAVHWKMVVCPIQDTTTTQCDLTDVNTVLIGQGDAMPIDGASEVDATFTPSCDLLFAAFEDDPYHGFDFLPVYAQLTINAGDESVVGFKRVNFTAWYDPTVPEPAPNENPFIPSLTIGAHLWAESEVVQLDDGPYELLPTLDPAWEVTYQVPNFDGTYLTFTENWVYDYFATAGSFDFAETGGEAQFIGTEIPIQTDWSGPGDSVERDITFWVVVRDGRGGENWAVRTAHYGYPDGGT